MEEGRSYLCEGREGKEGKEGKENLLQRERKKGKTHTHARTPYMKKKSMMRGKEKGKEEVEEGKSVMREKRKNNIIKNE